MSVGVQQRHFDYVLGPNQDARLASVAAGTTITGLELRLDSDAPFILRSRAVRQTYVDGGANLLTLNNLQYLKTRWTGPTSDDYRQQAMVLESLQMVNFGLAGNPKPIWPNVFYPASTVITVDLQNTGSNAITNLYLYFRGVKLYPPGAVAFFTYPPAFASGPFNYPIPVASLGVSERRTDQTFTVSTDADFVLRGAQATPPFQKSTGGAARKFSEVFIRLFDADKKPYSNDYMPLDMLWGAGSFPTAIPVGYQSAAYVAPWGPGPALPGLFYPEIYLPANNILIYNLLRSDGAVNANQSESFTINLIGSKVYHK